MERETNSTGSTNGWTSECAERDDSAWHRDVVDAEGSGGKVADVLGLFD